MKMEIANKACAFEDEDGNVLIYGTHDSREASRLYVAHLLECGFAPGDAEWNQNATKWEFYTGMSRYFTEPKDEEQPFDTKTVWSLGLVGWMIGLAD